MGFQNTVISFWFQGAGDEVFSVSDLKALWTSLSDIAYLQTSLQCTVTLSEYEAVRIINHSLI